VSRAPQLRSGRVLRFRPASLGTLMGSVAEELRDSKDMEWSTCRRGPLSIDFRVIQSVLNACFNVKIWRFPANGSRIYMSCARPVGLTLIGDRVRMW